MKKTCFFMSMIILIFLNVCSKHFKEWMLLSPVYMSLTPCKYTDFMYSYSVCFIWRHGSYVLIFQSRHIFINLIADTCIQICVYAYGVVQLTGLVEVTSRYFWLDDVILPSPFTNCIFIHGKCPIRSRWEQNLAKVAINNLHYHAENDILY